MTEERATLTAIAERQTTEIKPANGIASKMMK